MALQIHGCNFDGANGHPNNYNFVNDTYLMLTNTHGLHHQSAVLILSGWSKSPTSLHSIFIQENSNVSKSSRATNRVLEYTKSRLFLNHKDSSSISRLLILVCTFPI